MAQFFPNLEVINKLKVTATDGELFLLEFLAHNLPDDYEVFFQPMLNGDFPDIIIMRQGFGLMIIEVKDWSLKNYSIHKILKNNRYYYDWKLNKNGADIKSPIDQVENYKENIYNIHVDHLLLEYQIKKGNKIFGLIKTVVYFHNESNESLNKFFGDCKANYTTILGRDSLKNQLLFHLNTKNDYFSSDLYKEFKRILQPSIHTLEQGINLEYTPKQQELIMSRPVQQKVKGVAGCGKTLILAKRAVNAHKRTGGKVLILTYNITLRNYIHDNISKVREEFYWDNFYINNYHNFIKIQANRINLRLGGFADFDNPLLFSGFESDIKKYSAIFIDEIQDYKSEWIDIIKKYFLEENGEFVVFGDEKQNIYDRQLDKDKSPNTRVIGAWSKLNQSFRLSSRIANLATKFQQAFFAEKYSVENIESSQSQTQMFLEKEVLFYKNFPENTKFSDLVQNIRTIISENNFHNNDICFLSSKINILRSLDFEFRSQHIPTKTNFETQEIFNALITQYPSNVEHLKTHLKTVRNNKKFHFWMNDGNMKLSTIHSFKGWEIPTLFLILTKDDRNNELIYTAITRCRFNLIIINLDNSYYQEFFQGNLGVSPINITVVSDEEVTVGLNSPTIGEISRKECSMSNYLLNFKTGSRYKICILGELSISNRDFADELAQYFLKEGVKGNLWDIEFISNREMKQKNVLKQFRNGGTSYSLIITGQIHHHSSKGNEDANILAELKKDKYIHHIVGCDPHNKLSVTNCIDVLDEYLSSKLKRLNDELSKMETF